jgi:hypothetical protein
MLNRNGLKSACGVGWFVIDGEYDSEKGLLCLHLHRVTTGGITDVVEQPRELSKFQSYTSLRLAKPVKRTPIKCQMVDASELPQTLAYVLKPAWWRRDSFVNKKGEIKHCKRRALPDEVQARWLLWMNRWTVNDISMLFGMFVVDRQLRISTR